MPYIRCVPYIIGKHFQLNVHNFLGCLIGYLLEEKKHTPFNLSKVIYF